MSLRHYTFKRVAAVAHMGPGTARLSLLGLFATRVLGWNVECNVKHKLYHGRSPPPKPVRLVVGALAMVRVLARHATGAGTTLFVGPKPIVARIGTLTHMQVAIGTLAQVATMCTWAVMP